nr:hypothetical protein [uncultured Desulfobulbus sp.]
MELIIEDKPLTQAEHTRLTALESIIRENFLAYVAVGNALLEIRESRLYRNDDGRTWEGYCRELWDMSFQYADRLISASRVIENLTPIGVRDDGSIDWDLMPANESQARELARLEPEEQKQVWGQLIESKRIIPSQQPLKLTAKTVKNAVKTFKGEQVGGAIKNAGKKIKPRKPAETTRQSAEFIQAWEDFLEQIEIERQAGWKHTARETVFSTLTNLAKVVGECGEQTMRDRKIPWRANNLEKLLSAGFGIYRIGSNKTMIEKLEDGGNWLVFGEYENDAQAKEIFDDLLLEPTNLQA